MSGMEKIPIGIAGVTFRGRCRGPSEYHLADHELSVVFANSSSFFLKSGVGEIGTVGPFPSLSPVETARGDFHSASVGRRMPFQEANAEAS